MAKRLTAKDKEYILADFHTGEYSIRELADMYDTSHTTINKLTKGLEPKHKEKVSTIVALNRELYQESLQEVSSVNSVIEKKLQYLKLFTDAALHNQHKANKLLENTDRMSDVESHSRITRNNKDTVLGKTADVSYDDDAAQTSEIVITLDKPDD